MTNTCPQIIRKWTTHKIKMFQKAMKGKIAERWLHDNARSEMVRIGFILKSRFRNIRCQYERTIVTAIMDIIMGGIAEQRTNDS